MSRKAGQACCFLRSELVAANRVRPQPRPCMCPAHLGQGQDARLHPRHLHAALHLVNHPLDEVQRQRLHARGVAGATQGEGLR